MGFGGRAGELVESLQAGPVQVFELAEEGLETVVFGGLDGGAAKGLGLGSPGKPGRRVLGIKRDRGAAYLLRLLACDRGETAEGLALLEVGLGRFCGGTELLVAGGEGTQVYAVGLADAPLLVAQAVSPARWAVDEGDEAGVVQCRELHLDGAFDRTEDVAQPGVARPDGDRPAFPVLGRVSEIR